MRTGKMKNVLKKIGAFTLAFIMAVPMIGGWSETVRADVTGSNFCKIVVEQKDENGNAMSLEKDDELTLKIVATGNQPNVCEFTGSLVFINENEEDIGECFDDIRKNDYGSDLGSVGLEKAGRYHEFKLTSDNGVDINVGDEILWVTLRVERAVNKDVCIKFQGADPNKKYCFELKRRPANPVVVNYTPINTTITNKWYGKRKLSFTVAGNSERTDDAAIDVPVKNTKTKKTRIAVRINKDNGTDKGTGDLGYACFTLSYAFNEDYLSLDTDDKENEIYYELSDNVKNYEEKVDDVNIIPPPKEKVYDEDGRRRITATFMSQSGEDIRVYGDFLYLTFVPKNKSQKLGLADVEANVEVTLCSGENSAKTTMTTEVQGGQPYRDEHSDINGGTKTFRVNFVKTLIRFGDVNNDTYVNLIDALMVLQYYNDPQKYPLTDEQKERANVNDDFDKDGKLNIGVADVAIIIRYVNGGISELPYTTSN